MSQTSPDEQDNRNAREVRSSSINRDWKRVLGVADIGFTPYVTTLNITAVPQTTRNLFVEPSAHILDNCTPPHAFAIVVPTQGVTPKVTNFEGEVQHLLVFLFTYLDDSALTTFHLAALNRLPIVDPDILMIINMDPPFADWTLPVPYAAFDLTMAFGHFHHLTSMLPSVQREKLMTALEYGREQPHQSLPNETQVPADLNTKTGDEESATPAPKKRACNGVWESVAWAFRRE